MKLKPLTFFRVQKEEQAVANTSKPENYPQQQDPPVSVGESNIEPKQNKEKDYKNSPYVLTIVNSWKKSSLFLAILSTLITLSCGVFMALWFTKQIDSTISGITNLKFLVIPVCVISLFFAIHSILRYRFIKNVLFTLRESGWDTFYLNIQALFYKEYRKLNLLQVHLNWILLHVITFYGLFTLIIYLLRETTLDLGSSDSTYQVRLDFAQILHNAFGNINTFSLINLIILSVFASFIVMWKIIINYKIKLITVTFKQNFFDIEKEIQAHKKVLNRRYFIGYIILSIITLIPLTILFWKVLKKMIKK